VSVPLTTLEPVRDAVLQRPFGLLCDVDGTLSPMAAAPDDARITPRNLALLRALSQRGIVAAVSGRDLPDLRRMFATDSLVLVGLHGLAWLVDGHEQLLPEAEPYRTLTLEAAQQLRALRAIDGLFVEVKTVGLAYHYRGAADPATARQMILDAIVGSPAAAHFQVHEGILLIELRPPLVSNKGIAVRRLVDRFSLQGLLYLGDDTTDIDALVEARRLRESGAGAAWGIAVTHPEASPQVASAADFSVPDVAGVEWLLGEVARAIGADAGGAPPVGR
jgi:trehalose 6-phosphate phosphatase